MLEKLFGVYAIIFVLSKHEISENNTDGYMEKTLTYAYTIEPRKTGSVCALVGLVRGWCTGRGPMGEVAPCSFVERFFGVGIDNSILGARMEALPEC